MASKTVAVAYDARGGVAKITGPGGFTQLWIPRLHAEAVAKALGVTLEVSGP